MRKLTRLEIIREVATLASGTLAGLFGTRRYDEIQRLHVWWIEWLETTDDYRFATWQEAWEARWI